MADLVMLARDVPPDLMEFFESVDRGYRTDVFTVATEATPFAHFATYPTKLIAPLISAGCPARCCAECGAPWVRVVEASGGTIGASWHDHSADSERGMTQGIHSGGVGNARDGNGNGYARRDLGFRPTCDHAASTVPGLVLDPFMGSGTTALVARALGRDYIGCDLSQEYVNIAHERLRQPFEEHHVTKETRYDDLPLFADLKDDER